MTHDHSEEGEHETRSHRDDQENRIPIRASHEGGERSIRNISMPQRQRRMHEMREGAPMRRGSRGSRWVLWIIAGVCVLALGLLAFVAMRPTVVTVEPRTQSLSFDGAEEYTAYPAATAASGTLAYSVRTIDLEDSEVVPSNGMVHAEEKASGIITVYNDFQTSPLTLIKTTRFESADGHIFRTPEEVVIPGKTSAGPGHVDITVIADQAGEAYNVAAGRFTVPGLKSSADMYAKVYAQSAKPMTGGFSGERPGVASSDLTAAISQVRTRLEAKARESVAQIADGVALPDLMRITYKDEPQTTEAGGGVRVHESAHVQVPVFPSPLFVESAADIDSTGALISFRPEDGFSARLTTATSTLSVDPLTFTLSGPATLVWGVDKDALAAALAGQPQSAFEGIVARFPGIQEAHSRVEPFWKGAFPEDKGAIEVTVEEPEAR